MKTDTDVFYYSSNELFVENVRVSDVVQDFGSPVYIYSKAALINRVQRLKEILNDRAKIFFAVKACSNTHILKILNSAGCGADIVSAGELFRASVAEIPPKEIVYSGVGKTEKELREALKAQISAFNVESVSEFQILEKLGSEFGAKVPVCLRVNPNIKAGGHPHLATGSASDKFGLSLDELKEIYTLAKRFKSVQIEGLSCHIGSQILSAQPFEKAWKGLLKLAKASPFPLNFLNLGGGLGIPYRNEKYLSLENYARLILKVFKNEPYTLGIEPGRSIVAPSCVLATTVTHLKKRKNIEFLILDAGMNDLIRPALYGAFHACLPARIRGKTKKKYTLVGPVCESADVFQKNYLLPMSQEGDVLVLENAGAYGMSMASQYNSRSRPAEVLVDGASCSLIRSRESYGDLIQHEILI